MATGTIAPPIDIGNGGSDAPHPPYYDGGGHGSYISGEGIKIENTGSDEESKKAGNQKLHGEINSMQKTEAQNIKKSENPWYQKVLDAKAEWDNNKNFKNFLGLFGGGLSAAGTGIGRAAKGFWDSTIGAALEGTGLINKDEDDSSGLGDVGGILDALENLLYGETEKTYQDELHKRAIEDQLEKYNREIIALRRAGLSPNLMYGYNQGIGGAVPQEFGDTRRKDSALELILQILMMAGGLLPKTNISKIVKG